MSQNADTGSTPKDELKKVEEGAKSISETGTFRNHRLFLDTAQVARRQKGPMIILLLVALIASVIGSVLILQDQKRTRKSSQRPVISAQEKTREYSCVLEEGHPVVMTAGMDDFFYVAYAKKLISYRLVFHDSQVSVEKRDNRYLDETPTALLYMFNGNPLIGSLLVAYERRIEIFDPQHLNTRSKEFLVLGEGSSISGLTADADSIFVADKGLGVVHRFDLNGQLVVKIGEPNEETGFPGFRLDKSPFFDLSYSLQNRKIYVTNPGVFRIEAFDPVTGRWDAELSWEKHPGERDGFTGPYNPAQICLLPNGTLLTAEYGRDAPVRIFDLFGTQQLNITLNSGEVPNTDGSFRLASVGRSMFGKNYLLILSTNGKLDIYPEAL